MEYMPSEGISIECIFGSVGTGGRGDRDLPPDTDRSGGSGSMEARLSSMGTSS